MKRWGLLALQSVVTVALLAWVFRDPVERERVGDVLRGADPAWLVAGLAVAGFGVILGIVRWGIFLRVLGIRVGAWETTRLTFVGLFFNTFLVGAVGGDAVKVVWLAAKGWPKAAALLSVVLDRMSGLGALVLCSAVLILPRLGWLQQSAAVAGLTHFVVAFLGVVVAAAAVSFVLTARGVVSRLPERAPFRRQLIECADAYFQFVRHWRSTLVASGLSLVMLLAYFATFYCAARACGIDLDLMRFFAIMPTVDIITALPISLGGVGVREQVFVMLMGELFGVAAGTAVTISLTGYVLGVAWGLVGLALLPGWRREKPVEREGGEGA